MSKSVENTAPASSPEQSKLQVCGTIPTWLVREFRGLGGSTSDHVAAAIYGYLCMKSNLRQQLYWEAMGTVPSQREEWEQAFLVFERDLLDRPGKPPTARSQDKRKGP